MDQEQAPWPPLAIGVHIELAACGEKRYVFSEGNYSHKSVSEWVSKRGGPGGYYSAQKYLYLSEELYIEWLTVMSFITVRRN